MNGEHHFPLARGVDAAAPYSTRPPSPPYIHVPSIGAEGQTMLTIRPDREALFALAADPDPARRLVTPADLERIFSIPTDATGPSPVAVGATSEDEDPFAFTASDSASFWRYEDRRLAQAILPGSLLLGPVAAARDADFLRRERVSMLLCVRDARLASAKLLQRPRYLVPAPATNGDGAQAGGETEAQLPVIEYIDVADSAGLVAAFPLAVRTINAHLVSGGRNDKCVMVCCETGNHRSATLTTAYLMTMFGLDLVRALQFVGLQRFCVIVDDEVKNILRAWQDILSARRDVARLSAAAVASASRAAPASGSATAAAVPQRRNGGGRSRNGNGNGVAAASGASTAAAAATATAAAPATASHKRPIEATMDIDDETTVYDENGPIMDTERHQGRSFVPFVETDTSMEEF